MAGEDQRASVLDPDETWHLPAQVYVAARPDGGSGGAMLELRTVGDQERAAILAYSSLDQFLDGCGADQPWILLPAERLAALAGGASENAWEAGGFTFSVLLDVPLTAELRATAAGMAHDEPSWDQEDSADWAWVYLPSRPFRAGDEQAQLELQPMPGDLLALMAYTSESALEIGCGPHQPSVPIPAGLVTEARRQAGAHTICLDTPLPDYLRHGQEERNHRWQATD